MNEIYTKIPDFGGFLVKANSEGQPGPQTYNRTHADGAKMMSDALGTRGGVVLWRAFVYTDNGMDRIRQAYDEFKPLDGMFGSNAMVQVKNGPLDFQPREPFSPLFGAMPTTPVALELQITKEYLGEDTHLAYLGPMYEEVLKADTYAKGAGSTVARVIDGTVHGYANTAISGVANIGSDTNWTGSHFNQANWYVFGRMAWDPDVSARDVADEWIRQTLSNDPVVVAPGDDDDDGFAPGGGELHDAARAGAHHGHRSPLRSGAVGQQPQHRELEPVLLSQGRRHRDRLQPHVVQRRQQRRVAVLRDGARPVREPHHRGRRLPAVLPPGGLGRHASARRDGRSGTSWFIATASASTPCRRCATRWTMVQGRIDARRFNEIRDFLQTQHYEARWWRDACLHILRERLRAHDPGRIRRPGPDLSYYMNLATTCPSDATKPRCPAINTGNPSPAITP